MSNRKSLVVNTKSVPPKTTKMNDRAAKQANKSGKQPMMYSNGSSGRSGNGLRG